MTSYDEIYLENAQVVLARMLDYSVNDLNFNIDEMMKMFINTNIAKRFEKGDSSIVAGKSGVELARLVIELSTNIYYDKECPYHLERSKEYWAGWSLCYYQWKTCKTFKEITDKVSTSQIVKMYIPYHEMDILQFCDEMDILCSE